MNKIVIIFILLFFVILVIFGFSRSPKSTASPSPIPAPSPTPKAANTAHIDEIGVTVTIPDGMHFTKQEQMNLTTNKPYAVNFSIQNYQETINEVPHPYQLYAIYQWDTEPMTEEQFKTSDFSFDPNSKQEFTIEGHPAASGTPQGERARYTTYIVRKGHLFVLAASETDSKQREITEAIIKSLHFDQ